MPRVGQGGDTLEGAVIVQNSGDDELHVGVGVPFGVQLWQGTRAVGGDCEGDLLMGGALKARLPSGGAHRFPADVRLLACPETFQGSHREELSPGQYQAIATVELWVAQQPGDVYVLRTAPVPVQVVGLTANGCRSEGDH